MKVKLTYFKTSGKYYSEGEFETGMEHMFEIFEVVRKIRNVKRLPGLVDGHSEYHVLIDVPDHPHNHPHLITARDQ